MRIQLNYWYLLINMFYFSLLVSNFSLFQFPLSISFDEYRWIFTFNKFRWVSMYCRIHEKSNPWLVVSMSIGELSHRWIFRWVVIDLAWDLSDPKNYQLLVFLQHYILEDTWWYFFNFIFHKIFEFPILV